VFVGWKVEGREKVDLGCCCCCCCCCWVDYFVDEKRKRGGEVEEKGVRVKEKKRWR
jgi:hypothetical protein